MSKLDQTSASSVLITFHGDDVRRTLQDNYLVTAAIWKLCGGLLDAEIKVYTTPRTESNTLEWVIRITSPSGRRTLMARQRHASAAVSFSND